MSLISPKIQRFGKAFFKYFQYRVATVPLLIIDGMCGWFVSRWPRAALVPDDLPFTSATPVVESPPSRARI